MKPFDYVVMLVSLLLAIAATELFSTVATLINERDHLCFAWKGVPYTLWLLNSLLLLPHYWFAIQFDQPTKWTGWRFFYYLIQPGILTIMCLLVRFEEHKLPGAGLKSFFDQNASIFFLLAASIPVLTILTPKAMGRNFPTTGKVLFALTATLVLAIMAFVPGFQLVGTIIVTILFFFYSLYAFSWELKLEHEPENNFAINRSPE